MPSRRRVRVETLNAGFTRSGNSRKLLALETRRSHAENRTVGEEADDAAGIRVRRSRRRCGWSARCGRRRGSSGGDGSWVAEQLGYGVESVRSWVRQADVDDGVTRQGDDRGVCGGSRSSSRRTGSCVAQMRFCSRAATFFGAELDRQQRR